MVGNNSLPAFTGKDAHTLTVRKVNVEEKRLVRQDSKSTRFGRYSAIILFFN